MTEQNDLKIEDLRSGTGPFVAGVQSSKIPMIFVDLLAEANSIVMANTSFLQMTGIDQSKILGESLAMALADTTDTSNIKFITERLAEDQPGTWEITFNRLDGSTYVASVLMHPLRDQAGIHRQHVLSFYVFDNQIDRPINSDEETRSLYKHAPGFIATTHGAQHRITFVNDSYKQFVGYEELEGLTVAEAMPEIAEQGFIAVLDSVFETGVPFRGEAVPFDLLDAASGRKVRRYANFVYEPIRDIDRNIVGIFCEGYDVTDQKEAEVALQTLKTKMVHTTRVNAMGTMAATMAHELHQPLSAIINYTAGCLNLIERNDPDKDLLKDALLSIKGSADRAGAIIRTLRDLTDRRVGSTTLFKLKPVVEQTIRLIRSGCSNDTNVDAVIPHDLMLEADRIQIQQVIINLVRNGCEAVAKSAKQTVTVSAQASSDAIVVSVRDTGPGIDDETARGIFTWSDSLKEDGMGLGLSISRTIIEAHGGRIWLEGSSEKGSEFRFSIPAER